MTIHGLLGHTTALGVSVRKDIREFYSSCVDDAKNMYDLTIELLLKKEFFREIPIFILPKALKLLLQQTLLMDFSEKGDVYLLQK